jgi:hypothetical protein
VGKSWLGLMGAVGRGDVCTELSSRPEVSMPSTVTWARMGHEWTAVGFLFLKRARFPVCSSVC